MTRNTYRSGPVDLVLQLSGPGLRRDHLTGGPNLAVTHWAQSSRPGSPCLPPKHRLGVRYQGPGACRPRTATIRHSGGVWQLFNDAPTTDEASGLSGLCQGR